MFIKEVMTFKSGKFLFCGRYDQRILEKLLIEASLLTATVKDLPLLPAWSAQIEPELLYSSIAGTAAIEGNTINEHEVKAIAEGKISDTGHSAKDRLEIRNLIRTYQSLDSLESEPGPFLLTEAHIRELHHQITNGLPYENNIPGAYRNGMVQVGDKAHGGIYTPPKIIEDVQTLMMEFIVWINSEEIIGQDVFIRAALAHYHLSLIHPFRDGNGRVARLIEALLLQTAGIRYVPKMLSNYYYRHVDEYYMSFSKSIRGDKEITPFVEFTLKGVIDSLQNMKDRIALFIRKLVLRDYIHFLGHNKSLSKRQIDLLTLMLDNWGVSFTLNELSGTMPFSMLYRRVSTLTARRDLKKLSELNLLALDESRRYVLNSHALEARGS